MNCCQVVTQRTDDGTVVTPAVNLTWDRTKRLVHLCTIYSKRAVNNLCHEKYSNFAHGPFTSFSGVACEHKSSNVMSLGYLCVFY